ncbi:hypothetical protein [Amycolatopsis sp. NPDC004079]|uniref:hypothetical protein n=1 Tax=Amycolatopsis sp. NPDC004079 TaxID=3154549 RepID=UPI0033A00926
MPDKAHEVVVTIYSDGETDVSAPPDVDVTIRYEDALGDALCGCAHTIRRDENGDWFHIDAPSIWGGDHDPEPRD